MNAIKHILYSATTLFIMFACNSKQESVVQESKLIEITKQQFTTEAMQLGEIELKTFENTIKCNGSIVPLPNGMAKVNAPVNGIIKSIKCHSGLFVNQNQILLEITGNEIIDIQKDFAEASSNYHRLKNEYNRIKSLYDEKVTSEKDFIVAESEFKISMARYNGLKMKVEAIGFSISKIENGEFYTFYTIKSPISGYISNIKANLGSMTDPQSELLEIINTDMFQIKLSVFATDIINLKKGQTVRFKSTNSEETHSATISYIGVELDNDTKSIVCYALIGDKKLLNPIANAFVESEIITGTEMAQAISSDAIIKTETGYAILALEKQEKDKYYFKKVEVKVGRQQNGYSEILNNKITGLLVTKGAYNINLD